MGNRYVNTGRHAEAGGCRLNVNRVEVNPIDADGNAFEVPEVGSMWKVSTQTFDGEVAVRSRIYLETFWKIDLGDYYFDLYETPYDTDVFLGSQEPEGSTIFAGDILVESMFVGDTPVSAAYVGNAQVFPVKVVPDYKMEVTKVVKGWNGAEGKFFIDYNIKNTGKEPMFITAEVLRATEQEVAPGDTYTAGFWAVEEGTYNIAITARTINDYVFDVYEDEAVVPSINDVVEYSYKVVLGTASGSSGITPGTINPRSGTDWWMNNTDLNGKIHPLSGDVWTIEGEGQKEVLVFDRWNEPMGTTDGTLRVCGETNFTSSFSSNAIWTMKQGDWSGSDPWLKEYKFRKGDWTQIGGIETNSTGILGVNKHDLDGQETPQLIDGEKFTLIAGNGNKHTFTATRSGYGPSYMSCWPDPDAHYFVSNNGSSYTLIKGVG